MQSLRLHRGLDGYRHGETSPPRGRGTGPMLARPRALGPLERIFDLDADWPAGRLDPGPGPYLPPVPGLGSAGRTPARATHLARTSVSTG